MNLATLAERGIAIELDGDQLRVRGDLDDELVATIRAHRATLIAELRWPYQTAAEEPRCKSCLHWISSGAVFLKTGELIGECTEHQFDALELDNCKRHQVRSGDDEQ